MVNQMNTIASFFKRYPSSLRQRRGVPEHNPGHPGQDRSAHLALFVYPGQRAAGHVNA